MQLGYGPKPVKGIRIDEEARWVRQIFEWFVVLMWSINAIARELTRLKVPKGNRSQMPSNDLFVGMLPVRVENRVRQASETVGMRLDDSV
jgi:hypothetical protein